MGDNDKPSGADKQAAEKEAKEGPQPSPTPQVEGADVKQ